MWRAGAGSGALVLALALAAAGAAAQDALLRAPSPRPARAPAPLVSEMLRDPAVADVVVCAHRGNGAGAPENSIAAIRLAPTLGARMIEVDVRETRDGALVLMHDPSPLRTTENGVALISRMTLDEVRALRLRGAPDMHPPTLAEAIAAARGLAILQLDMKTGNAALVAKAIADADAFDRVTCGHADFAVLAALRKIDERIHVIPRCKRAGDLARALAPELAAVAVQIETEMLEPEVVGAIHASGARVWVNSLGALDRRAASSETPRVYRELIDAGTDIIQTDRPELLAPVARVASLERYPW